MKVNRCSCAGSMLSTRSRIAVTMAMVVLTALATAGLAAAASPGGCKLAKIAEWPVRSGIGQPVVDGAINGWKIGVLLDTGAERTMITRSAAARLHLVLRAVRGQRMSGVGGETALDMVFIEKFEIGGSVLRNRRMLVAGEHDFGDIAVILGDDFFHQADVEFDLPGNAIRLFESKDCGDASLAYWNRENAGQVKIKPVDGTRPAIAFTVELNGKPILAQLDSGAYPSLLTESRAGSLGIRADTTSAVAAGCITGLGRNSISSWSGGFETFLIGDEIVRNPRLLFADFRKFRPYTFEFDQPDMLLGADFLRAHRVLVAHSQGKMYFTYAGGPVFPTRQIKACDNSSPQAPDAKPAAGVN